MHNPNAQVAALTMEAVVFLPSKVKCLITVWFSLKMHKTWGSHFRLLEYTTMKYKIWKQLSATFD